LSTLEILFGRGMERQEFFVPGWSRCYMYFGIIGLLAMSLLFILLLFQTRGYARLLVLCLIVLNFFADVMFGTGPLMILPYILLLAEGATTTSPSPPSDDVSLPRMSPSHAIHQQRR